MPVTTKRIRQDRRNEIGDLAQSQLKTVKSDDHW